MIHTDIQITGTKEIEKRLGNLKSKAPTVLARAINRAAQKAKTEAKREVAAKYFISQGNISETIKISRASTAKLSAELTSKGGPIALSKFKVSPNRRAKKTKKGYSPSVYEVGVEREGGMKPLSGNPKAFIATMRSGHVGVMERKSTVFRLPIKQLYGPAVPSMIKNDEVMEHIQDAASEMLERRISAEVNNILRRGR